MRFLNEKNNRCIPLFLNSFGSINGFGVYQLVEDVIIRFSQEEVIPHLIDSLNSNEYSVRYWTLQIAANFPSAELLPQLKTLLQEDDFDLKYNTLTALGQFDGEVVKSIVEDFLKKEKDEELIGLAKDILVY
jgi:HEAT repeat protein